MIDVDRMLLEINIRNRQTTKFRNAKTCFEQYVDSLIIPAKMRILLHKPQKLSFLRSADCFSCHTVIHNHFHQLKLKWIFPDQVIIHRQLKCRTKNSSDRMDGTIAFLPAGDVSANILHPKSEPYQSFFFQMNLSSIN